MGLSVQSTPASEAPVTFGDLAVGSVFRFDPWGSLYTKTRPGYYRFVGAYSEKAYEAASTPVLVVRGSK